MNNIQHTCRFPQDLYEKLVNKAIEENRTFNGQLMTLLEGIFGQSDGVKSRIAMKTLTRQITSAP